MGTTSQLACFAQQTCLEVEIYVLVPWAEASLSVEAIKGYELGSEAKHLAFLCSETVWLLFFKQ